MTYPVHWISIDIGYESLVDDSSGGKPLMQAILESLFRKSALQRWAEGGHTVINDKPVPCNHRWVREVIQTEINNELAANGRNPTLIVRNEDVCVAVARPYSPSLPLNAQAQQLAGESAAGAVTWEVTARDDKDVHTRCKLIDDVWMNSRTYRLSQIDGKGHGPWMHLPQQSIAFLMATLTWPCHDAGPSALEHYPQAPSMPMDATSTAARSRDAGKPAGASGSRAKTRRRRSSP